jgi:quinolinate synthase
MQIDYNKEIHRLRREKNAVILAHNYQIPEVQDIADYTGDSLGLARQAAKTDADIIVFCGVHFMAETAAILSPQKKVLLPDLEAGCSLADSIKAEQLRAWKKNHPDAVVVAYVNTTAAVKAESDYCVTSSNAVQVVESIPADQRILFLPDKYLGSWVIKETGRDNIELWDGACHVHEGIQMEDVNNTLKQHSEADLLLHPECGCTSNYLYNVANEPAFARDNTFIYSTSGMIKHVQQSPAETFLIGTETGIIHQMRKSVPDKDYVPVSAESVCEYMKMINIENLYEALRDDKHVITVDPDLASRARLPIDRMIAIG